MSFFGLFKKPVILEDDFWGKLKYITSKNAEEGYFEGKTYFSPGNIFIELHIDADIAGPSGQQKEFYKELQANFQDYVRKITPLIEDEFRNWKEDFEIKEFMDEFTLVWLTIPRLEVKPVKWEMAFTTVHDENHHITIEFTDSIPSEILIDG